MAYLNRKQRNQLLQNQIDENRVGMLKALKDGRRRVEMRIIEAARNERFATVRRIRDGIYKDIGEEYKRLQGDLDEWSKDSILRTSKVYHGLAAADLLATDDDRLASSFAKFSAKHNEEYFAKIHPFNAEKLAAVNVHLNPQLVRMAETDVRALRTATVDALREAHIAGMTPQERAKLLRGKVMDYADNPASWKFIDRSGKRWKKNNYFDMLNRTVTANVARDTYHDALVDEQRDLVVLLGGTSAESHPACEKFNGKVLSLTGQTPGFPTLDEYIGEGGFHPNCVHSTAYVSKDFGPHRKLIEEQGGEIEEVRDVVEFKPAKTIKEAEEWAVNNGIADKADYNKLSNIDVANAVNSASARMVNRYGKKYDKIRAAKQTSAQNAGTPMYHHARIKPDGTSTHELVVNEGYFGRFGSTDEIIKNIAESRADQWWAARNIEDLAVHEYGHRLTAVKMYNARKGEAFVRPGGIYDYKNLGRYASSNADEAVAEVFNRYHQDGFIKDEWRILFNESSEVAL